MTRHAIVAALLLVLFPRLAPAADDSKLFDRANLVAWCIVPFDAKKRNPEERAAMLESLEIKRYAYDWRAEHLPTFDDELNAIQRHGIELTAVWFPGSLDNDAKHLLATLAKHGLKTQLWVTGGGEPTKSPEEQQVRVNAEAARIKPIAEAAAKQGCTVALYNHGGWFGEPENQIQIIKNLESQGVSNVGIVYNLHHGHDHLDRFPILLQTMRPYLVALNLNGMEKNGDTQGKKIMIIGQGNEDARLLTLIRDSGWHGPIGILNHTDEDAEARLRANRDGLEQLVKSIGD